MSRELAPKHDELAIDEFLHAKAALDLPTDGAINLFAIGRTVGWIGHAIEQYRRDRIIRPRARYIGDPPLQN